MRRAIVATVLSSLALFACSDAGNVTGPETPDPQLHVVPEADPDGEYSQYFVDLELVGDFWVKVAQEWDDEADPFATECPENDGTHADGDAPLPDPGEMHPATGSGYFSLRAPWGWRTGVIRVKRACWFDEWNGNGGFPESTWIAGWAFVGWRLRPFRAKLVSNGFPAEEHRGELDAAEFYLDGIQLGGTIDGELHHEDGTTIFR